MCRWWRGSRRWLGSALAWADDDLNARLDEDQVDADADDDPAIGTRRLLPGTGVVRRQEQEGPEQGGEERGGRDAPAERWALSGHDPGHGICWYSCSALEKAVGFTAKPPEKVWLMSKIK